VTSRLVGLVDADNRRLLQGRPTRSEKRHGQWFDPQGDLRCGRDRQEPSSPGKLGWKWSIVTDTTGFRVGWVAGPTNCNHVTMREATLEGFDDRGLFEEIETLDLDRGYDHGLVRASGRSGRRPPRRGQGPASRGDQVRCPSMPRSVIDGRLSGPTPCSTARFLAIPTAKSSGIAQLALFVAILQPRLLAGCVAVPIRAALCSSPTVLLHLLAFEAPRSHPDQPTTRARPSYKVQRVPQYRNIETPRL
jgi:hypothetical protein